MKSFLKIFLLLVFLQVQAQQSEIVVQAAHNGYITKTFIDSNRDLLISYGNYTDKTLKFWDNKTGILLRTIELAEYAKSVDFSEDLGQTFLGFENRIEVYSNDTFNKIKSYPVSHFHQMIYRSKTGKLLFFSGDYGNITLNTLDSKTGVIQKKSNSPYPSDGVPMYLRINKSGHHLSLHTEFVEDYIFDIEQDRYFLMQDMPIEIFENDDLLYVGYVDNTHVKLVRYNTYDKRIVWEKTLVIKRIDRMIKVQNSQIALTKDEKSFWIAPAKSTLIEIDANSGGVLGVIHTENQKRNIIADNNHVYALEVASNKLFSHGYYNKYRRYSRKPILRFGHAVFALNDFKPFNNKNELGFVFEDLYSNIASFTSNPSNTTVIKYSTNYKDSYIRGDLYIKPNSKDVFFATGDELEGVKSFRRGDKNSFVTKSTFSIDNTTPPVVNPIAETCIRVFDKHFEYIDLNTNELLYRQTFNDLNNVVSYDLKFSPTGKELAIIYNDEVQFDLKYIRSLNYYNLESKKLLWSIENNYTNLFFIENGTRILALNKDTQKAEVLEATTGNKIREFSILNEGYSDPASLNSTGKKLVTFTHERGIIVYDIDTGNIVSRTNNYSNNFYVDLDFITDQIYVVNSDGILIFYDALTHLELLRLYIFLDGEWIIHTPEGLFDGSQKAWERLVFVKGKETIPLNQIFNKFYTPRLFNIIMSGDDLDKPDVDIDKLKKAPTVSIKYSEGTRNLTVEDDREVINTKNPSAKITIEANANGDQISEIRLFHNGKRVGNNTRNLVVEDDEVSEESKTFTLTLLEGENTFEAVALNSQKTESTPRSLLVIYEKPKEVIQEAHGIQMHLMVIGIDAYKNPKYNLNYAVADANAFKEAVTIGMKPIISKVNTYFIENSNANKTFIFEQLNTISQEAKPQDIFLFYYAGHGVVTQDASKEFYLVPFDVTQLYGAEESLKQKGISAKELKAIASNILAQKQLYILDACQSAGALSAVASRGVVEEKAIAQLARSTGTHWLTASGSDQYATEFDELGHGVFTYALLEALSGKADSGDNKVTVNELKAYLESRVPEISEQYKGSPQYPSSFGFGQDFPVSVDIKN